MEISPELLASAKKGNLASFEQLLILFEAPIYNYIYRQVTHKQVAEDLTQETFIKLFKNLKKIKPEENFKSWVYTIATNTVYDYFRKKHYVKELFIIDDPESSFETMDPQSAYTIVEQIGAQQDLDKALEKLKPEYRTVLLLFYRQDLSYETIANILRVPLNTVKTYLFRAKKALKEELERK